MKDEATPIQLIFLQLDLTTSLNCFILFDAIINETVFLISFSDSLLLLYRKATDFCMLILYPATLLNY